MSEKAKYEIQINKDDPCTNEVWGFSVMGKAVLVNRTCPLYSTCKTHHAACEAFFHYVKSGECYDPKLHIPIDVNKLPFEPGPTSNLIIATSGLYEMAMKDDSTKQKGVDRGEHLTLCNKYFIW